MVFCKPRSVDDEFLLTENVFGIFEGPNNLEMNPVTQELKRGMWTEWHNFAPVSASLLIILRSNFLPGNIVEEGNDFYDKVYQTIIAMQPFPERAASLLQDLPVKRCTTSYATVRHGKVALNADYQGPSPGDQYTFECFELESRHVNLIDSLFLEEAISATSISYKSSTAIARAIRAYLEDPRAGFKIVYDENSARRRYLQALETALQTLGGTVHTIINDVRLPFMKPHPLDYGGHMARWVAFHTAMEIRGQHPQLMKCYRLLGDSVSTMQQQNSQELGDGKAGNDTRTVDLRWVEDIEQAGKIAFLHIKIDSALAAIAANRDAKRRCKEVRRNFFASLHPRFIWMYMKVLRNLDKFDTNNFIQQIRPLECAGPEDKIVQSESTSKMSCSMPARLTQH